MDFINSIPLFGGPLFTLIAFVAVLSIVVSIHEYGHYIVGRWCGIHAEVFSLGFGPIIYSRHDKRGTKWQLAAVPFGGYVKFLGDADASSRNDPEAMARMDADTRSKSFHGASLYKKALTIVAGPMANFILSSVIFFALILSAGLATDKPTIRMLKPLPQTVVELKSGDVILAINGVEIPDYSALNEYSRADNIAPIQEYKVLRGDRTMFANGPYPLLPLINSVQPQSAAMAAGLQVGDLILGVDGQKIIAFSELQKIVAASKGRQMDLEIWRKGDVINIALAAKIVDLPSPDGGFEQRTLIGITGGLFFEPETVTPGIGLAAKMGVSQVGSVISSSLSGLYHMVTGAISSCNLQGPLGIAKTSGDAASQGLDSFFWIVAVLSTAIGLLNLFPIPILDGGHLVFFAYEAVTKRPPSDKALNVLMSAGLMLIATLMIFGLSNDIFC